jgi:hypothetical protein
LIKKGRLAKCDRAQTVNSTIRKALWAHNKTQTNRATQPAPDSKADNSKIAAERGVNNSSASVKEKVAVNKAAANKVAVNKAVASKADDRTGSLEIKRAVGACFRRSSFYMSLPSPFGTLLIRCRRQFASNHEFNGRKGRIRFVRYKAIVEKLRMDKKF